MNNPKYAVRVTYSSGVNHLLMEDTGRCFPPDPALFDTVEDAESYIIAAGLAGTNLKLDVVEYSEEMA